MTELLNNYSIIDYFNVLTTGQNPAMSYTEFEDTSPTLQFQTGGELINGFFDTIGKTAVNILEEGSSAIGKSLNNLIAPLISNIFIIIGLLILAIYVLGKSKILKVGV